MEKEQLKRIFDFLKKEDNRNIPFLWKLLNNEPFTEKELDLKGDLELSNSEITQLPEGLKVEGGLILVGCDNLTSLPEGLEVKYSLGLSYCTNLKSLPEGLKVGINLHLKDCKNLTSLPKGLKVGYHLDISDSGLEDYSDEELIKMIGLDGYIKGSIFRD